MKMFVSVRDKIGIKIYWDVKSACVLDGKVYIEMMEDEDIIEGELVECWLEEESA